MLRIQKFRVQDLECMVDGENFAPLSTPKKVSCEVLGIQGGARFPASQVNTYEYGYYY